MIGKTNSGIILGIINVNLPNSSTVTVSNGNLSFTASGTSVSFKLPRAGTWTVSASSNGISETRNITVNPGAVVNVSMLTGLYLYNRGAYAFTRGWSRGEQSGYVTVNGNNNSISNGSVNLTGYRTLRAEVTGRLAPESYATCQMRFEITDTSGNVLQRQNETKERSAQDYSLTWTFDVSSINQYVKFRIATQGWSGGGEASGWTARINLYSIYLST